MAFSMSECVLALVLASGALSACGGGGGGEASPSSTAAHTPSTPSTPVEAAASAPAQAGSEPASAASAALAAASQVPSAAGASAAVGAAVSRASSAAASTAPPAGASGLPRGHAEGKADTPAVAQIDASSAADPARSAATGSGASANPATPSNAAAPARAAAATEAGDLLPTCQPKAQGCAYGAEPYRIGSYYFPGWTNNLRGAAFAYPWSRIRPFPAREPALGWYVDAEDATLRAQLQQMRQGGLHYVVMDSYWDAQGAFQTQALSALRRVWREGDPQFALLWANHYDWKGGKANLQRMVDTWAAENFGHAGYLRIDGRPVLFVFSIEDFERNAKEMGLPDAKALVNLMNARLRAASLPELYLVAGTQGLEHWAKGVAPTAGFQALSAYNYHLGYSGDARSASARPKDYPSLHSAYRQNWDWLVRHASLPYIVPMSSGWDSTPWLDPARNQSTYIAIATPEQFEAHLRSARALMDAYPARTLRMGVICCWNEWGEGSFIEPTKTRGDAVLRKVREVFHTP